MLHEASCWRHYKRCKDSYKSSPRASLMSHYKCVAVSVSAETLPVFYYFTVFRMFLGLWCLKNVTAVEQSEHNVYSCDTLPYLFFPVGLPHFIHSIACSCLSHIRLMNAVFRTPSDKVLCTYFFFALCLFLLLYCLFKLFYAIFNMEFYFLAMLNKKRPNISFGFSAWKLYWHTFDLRKTFCVLCVPLKTTWTLSLLNCITACEMWRSVVTISKWNHLISLKCNCRFVCTSCMTLIKIAY